MTRFGLVVSGFLIFALLATANAGGYRFGVSDQGFYIPAVELNVHPELFPRDRALLAPQMRLWLGDQLFANTARAFGGDLPTAFGVLYLVTLAALFTAAIALSRSLGCSWWTTSAFLLILTVRHRVMKTGVNSLEGYFHPRMLAFAAGLGALAAVARGRFAIAIALTTIAALVHTTTAAWFALVVVVAILVERRSSRLWLATVAAGALAVGVLLAGPLSDRLALMDDAWVRVFSNRDYLFPADWPIGAWIVNLGYALIMAALYGHRRRLNLVARGEGAIVWGLLALVVVFLISVPLTEMRLAIVVQAQVNRVFWLLDTMVACYLAWILTSPDTWRWRPRAPIAAVVLALLALASAGRALYVMNVEADRSLVRTELPETAWTDVMRWLRTQPAAWQVLADPGHAWLYGTNVRVAAGRDTVLEMSKDPILALYDRAVAERVADRMRAFEIYSLDTADGVRALATQYAADVFVTRNDRAIALPLLFRNDEFSVYDLR